MAKRVRVSDDGGTTWYTLPGNTAENSDEASELDDTIFGQDFQSSQTGLIGGTVNANGLFKGFAGYLATIKKSGTSTALTDEPMSVVSGKTYQVTDTAKRMFDRNVALAFEDNAVAVDVEDIESVDYLFGQVTFASGYTVTGPITVASGSYLPTAAVGCINAFTLTQTAQANDNTCMDTAQLNDGTRTFEYGLKTVSLEADGIYKVANGFKQLLRDRTELILEIAPDGAVPTIGNRTVARGFFKPVNTGASGDVGDLEQESITFNLAVPDQADLLTPFRWLIAANSTLNVGVQKVIEAWENKTLIKVAYLPDGIDGYMGDAVVTDVTLTGGLEAMNEFAANFQLSDETEAYA